MKAKLQLFFFAIAIFHSVQCIGQDNLGSLKGRYFFVDETYAKKLILSNSASNGLQLEVINMLIDRKQAKDYGSTTNLSYAISMIVLPKAGFSQYAFNDRIWQEVNYERIRDSIITFNEVVKLVDYSFRSIREEKDQDSDFEKSNGLSMKTRTYNLIPIIEIDSAFYIPNEAETMTQCFAIDNTTVPKTSNEQYNGYLYTKAHTNFSADSLRIIADELIDKPELFVNKTPRSTGFYDKFILLRKEEYTGTYNFIHLQINKWFIGPFYRNYSLKKYYGIGEFLFHPCIGIVGATYQSYLRSFYKWIPGIEKKQTVLFRAIQVNGIPLNHYLNLNCN